MRRFSQRQPLPALAEINVTPLLDLCFVLLVIFMIATPLLENSQELAVPTSTVAGTPVEPGKVNVLSINRDAEVRLDGEPVTPEELDARLRALKAERADATAVVIRAHRELPVQRFIALMDVLKRADIHKVGVVTQTPAEEEPGGQRP